MTLQESTVRLRKRDRKRLVVAREPSGRPRRDPEPLPASEVKRLRDAALRGLRDAEWGTELGRLYLHGAITEAMYAAGKRWAAEASRYQRAIDVFPVRSVSLERGVRAEPPDPDSAEGRRHVKRDLEAEEDFRAAHAVLMLAGLLSEATVRGVCERSLSLAGMVELTALRRGLFALAAHYRL